jgi:hypothetical protein
MARRVVSKPQDQELSAQVRLDIKADTPSFYVNYISVSHTPYDFTLTAARVPSPLLSEQLEIVQSGKPVPLEAILQIVVPPLLVEGLIKALIDQKNKYEKTQLRQVEKNEQQR